MIGRCLPSDRRPKHTAARCRFSPSSFEVRADVRHEKDGSESALPKFAKHLLCDQLGQYPAELKGWEQQVLDEEMQRDGFLFWYRNPDRPSQDSLGIAYEFEDDTKILRPDFLFFVGEGDDLWLLIL